MGERTRRLRPRISHTAQQGIVAIATLLAVIAFCGFLNRKDSWQTCSSTQPKAGVLSLSQQELEERSVFYLVDDWLLYPDRCLTPQLLEQPNAYDPVLFSFDGSQKPPSSGTLCMQLSLPPVLDSYSMILPPIPAAYQLYVNGSLFLNVNDSDIYVSREMLKEQEVCFQASGDTQLLLVYENQGQNCSVISGAPIFGKPVHIHNMADYRQIFFGASVTLTFLSMALSICMFCKSRRQHDIYLILLCISATVYFLCPLIKSFDILPQFFLQNLRIFSFFGCHTAVMWGYASYFEWNDLLGRIMRALSLIGLILAAVVGVLTHSLFAGLTLGLMYRNANMLVWFAIGNGILLTIRAIRSDSSQYGLLTASTVVLWAFLLVNQVMKGGGFVVYAKFPEKGIVVLMGLLIIAVYIDITEACHFRMLYADRMEQGAHLRKLSEAHYTQLQEQIAQTRMMRHDLRQHLRLIRTLLDQGSIKELSDYLERYTQARQDALEQPIQFCQIPVVDALLFYYWNAAQQQEAKFTISAQLAGLPEEMYVDVCTVMGNLLENALESLTRQTEGEKFIRLDCKIVQRKLVMQVVNSNTTEVVRKDTQFRSSKHGEFGVGTLSVQTIAQQYGGHADFSYGQGVFTARLVMSLDAQRSQSRK